MSDSSAQFRPIESLLAQTATELGVRSVRVVDNDTELFVRDSRADPAAEQALATRPATL
ncbi:hypothetical protein [Nocardia sp. XZ_19_369]|uniref:hypothetical protein n=1 Tax=Nocardia sp. XZ_19_369 TaxID=2769487 RepID=UPI00188E5CAC|nr:hypothetical protein [Nocardia sp. XZ_19_369]